MTYFCPICGADTQVQSACPNWVNHPGVNTGAGTMTTMKIWECKIGEVEDRLLPNGADGPMRAAVAHAYRKITGRNPQFIFSGWGAELTEGERAVVENRAPDQAKVQTIAPDWFRRSGLTEQKWDAVLQVLRAATMIGDHLAEFGTLEDIPETFDCLYASLEKCKEACRAAPMLSKRGED